MNKYELISKIYEETSLKRKDVDEVIEKFIEVVGDELEEGNKVSIYGFMILTPEMRKERFVVHPETGEKTKVPKKTVVKLKAGKKLSRKINKKR